MRETETIHPFSRAIELNPEGEQIFIFPEKFALWPKEKTIFLADTHFGKIAHFRKSGIGLPADAGMDTFFRLQEIILSHRPQRIIILGDVFHSDSNSDTARFIRWSTGFPEISFGLVLGNHDLASRKELLDAGFPMAEKLRAGPFHCVHARENISEPGFHFFGHIHPGISLSGLGGQFVKVPCFWLGAAHLCFPAFGSFTGFVSLQRVPGDIFFALTGKKVVPIGPFNSTPTGE